MQYALAHIAGGCDNEGRVVDFGILRCDAPMQYALAHIAEGDNTERRQRDEQR